MNMDNETPISVLKIGVKAQRALLRLHVKSISEFIALDLKDVLRLDGVGKKTVICLGVWQKKVSSILASGVVDEVVSKDDWELYQGCLSVVSQDRLASLGICSLDQFFSISKYTFLGRGDVGAIYWDEVDFLQEILNAGFEFNYGVGCESVEKERPAEHGLEHEWRLAYASFSVRTKNGLGRLSATTPKAFLKLTKDAFLGQRGVGKKCWNEIEAVQNKLFPLLPSGETSLWEPDPYLLSDYPLYSGLDLEDSSIPDELYPDTSVSSFVRTVRGKNALDKLEIKTLGELLLVRPDIFLELQSCGKKTVRDLRQSVEDYLEFRRNPEEAISTEDSLPNLIRRLCSEVGRSDRDTEISVLRICNGETLEAVAEMYGCTRERIRQIVDKSTNLIEEYSKTRTVVDFIGESICEILNSYRGIINANKLGVLLAEKMDWDASVDEKAVKELLRNFSVLSSQFSFNKNLLIGQHPCRECKYIQGIFSDYVLGIENQSLQLTPESMGTCQEFCRERTLFGCKHANLSVSEEFIVELGQRVGFKHSHGMIMSPTAISLAKGGVIKKAEASLRMLGGNRSGEEIWNNISDFSDISFEKFKKALLDSDVCLRWGKNHFIHKDEVQVERSVLEIIESEIEFRLSEHSIASINGVYNEFRVTFNDAGIPNQHALASVISMLSSGKFFIDRFRYIHSEKPSNRTSIDAYVEQWILEQDGGVRYSDIKQQMIDGFGMRESTVPSCFLRLDEIIPLADGVHIHIDNLDVKKKDLAPLVDWIESALNNHSQVGVHRLYEEQAIVCFQLGIQSSKMLYSLLRHFFSDAYNLPRFPHISRQGGNAISLNKALKNYLKERATVVSIDECALHFDTLGYSSAQMKARIPNIDGVFTYYPKCIIHSDVLGWNSKKGDAFREVLESAFKKRLGMGFPIGDLQEVFDEYEDALPELENGFGWTGELMSSVASGINQVSVIGNAKRAYTVSSLSDEISNLGDLVNHTVKNVFRGGCSRRELTKWMHENGVVLKQLTPSMFQLKDGLVMTEYECYFEKDSD